ncbi:non-canonical purine NTP pyrophosphatase, RdgB/HAM1 family [Bacteriovorax stolpii]|uniref:RdgB/HAM1 family non-canonical purine NTP pyrophosphatase n=1 Tax=Bacteriovorax stolpii TaxID=960 RepID=UPI00115A1A2C|nr:RdgB/HAM1 family non-canonical purine NTP pyrophosphatase [Bacteriovorax stolpii]QDK40165.1 non-canonical purine NTP pyrophosphatase, RdgB/HAM1 family [Bacteriovorax stolpii]
MELLLASGNAHKAEEFSELFDPKILVVKAAPEKIDVAEDGSTYFENALLKAKAYYDKFKVPVIADDSGLNVQSLPNELGLHSARFGGPGLTDRDRAELLLKKMDGVSEREAYFSCVLCVYFSEKEIFYFEGRLNGSIGYSYRGSTGFGYDPVFIPTDKAEEGLTVAELHEWKQKNSHRAVASALLSKFLAQRN